jgi:hypothetical protein
MVDAEHLNRGTTDGCLSSEEGTGPFKMSTPFILTRVEESYDLEGLRITACNVRSYEGVAVEASESEVSWLCRAAMLLGDDVVGVKRKLRKGGRKVAVFAATSCRGCG